MVKSFQKCSSSSQWSDVFISVNKYRRLVPGRSQISLEKSDWAGGVTLLRMRASRLVHEPDSTSRTGTG